MPSSGTFSRLCRPRALALLLSFLDLTTYAQLSQINPAKLPRSENTRAAYSNLIPVEPMARNWSPKWPYGIPKTQVTSILMSSLHELRSAQNAEPQNEELFLLTGLVAHMAYNVDVEEAYDTAVKSLEIAHKLAPADYRPDWFLGIHLCQSNGIQKGMEKLLAVEERLPWQQLPLNYWDDYITCSTLSLMPAHTLRAIDHAQRLGAAPARYISLVETTRKQYVSTNATSTYSAHRAWNATQTGETTLFGSELCGMRFSLHGDWHVDVRDVTNGVCQVIVETGPYQGKNKSATPTLLVMTRSPKPQEKLEDFVHSLIQKYPSAHVVEAPACPSGKCLAFEVTTDSMYKSEGGGHLLIVGFTNEPPEFPGIRFEAPEPPPPSKPETNDKITYYRPTEKLQRLPGTLYSVVLLDSNASIFSKAASDFEYLLQSIQLD